jgi:hypothetical protein
MKRHVVGTISVFAVYGLLGTGSVPTDEAAMSSSSSSGPAAPAAPVAPATPRVPDIETSAAEILQAYQANQIAADTKYKNKRIRVKGVVDNVTNGVFGGYDLNINTGKQFEVFSVTCSFKNAEVLATIQPGQSVVVDGDFSSGMTIGVNLKNCALVE